MSTLNSSAADVAVHPPAELARFISVKYPVFALRADKKPATIHGFKSATQDAEEIRRQFEHKDAVLIGVPTGDRSNLFVLDIDPEGLPWLEANRERLPVTRTHHTARGYHFLFKMPPGVNLGCTAGTLAPGVDTRGTGGYIVWHPAAGRPFDNPQTYADIPEWLLAELGAGLVTTHTTPADPFANLRNRTGITPENAAALIRHTDPDSYSNWIQVGMGLHHEYGDDGLPIWELWSRESDKFSGEEECARKWATFGLQSGPPVTLRATINAAKRNGAPARLWGGSSAPTSMPALVGAPAVDFTPAHEFVKGPPIAWHIKHVIPKAALGMAFGSSGDGKTFLLTDIALHMAAGKDWRSHRTRAARVAVICAEGAGGYKQRIRGAAQHYGIDLRDLVLEILPAAPQLADKAVVADLVARIEARGGFDVLIVDTLAQVSAGLDENSSDMQTVLTACGEIHRATGATVILIHHAGKDASKGARGWSGVRAAVDFEIEVARNPDDTREARVSKQKDGRDGARYGFRLAPICLDGVADEDGEPVWSCYLDPVDVLPKTQAVKRGRMGPTELTVEQATYEVCGIVGRASASDIVTEAVRRMAAPEAGERDLRRQHAKRALDTIAAKGVIALLDGVVTVHREAPRCTPVHAAMHRTAPSVLEDGAAVHDADGEE